MTTLTRLPKGLTLWPNKLPAGQAKTLDQQANQLTHIDWAPHENVPIIATTVTGTARFTLGSNAWYYVAVTTAGTAVVDLSATAPSTLSITTGTTSADITAISYANSVATPAHATPSGTLQSTRDFYFGCSITQPAVTTGQAVVGFGKTVATLASYVTTQTGDGVWVTIVGTTLTVYVNGQGATGGVSVGSVTGLTAGVYDVQVFYESKTRRVTAAYRQRSGTGLVTIGAWTNLAGAVLTTTQVANWTGTTTPVGPILLAATTAGAAYTMATDYMTLIAPRALT